MTRQLCLYCFEHFDPFDMLVRCQNQPEKCEYQEDETYDEYWDLTPGERAPRGRLAPVSGTGLLKRTLRRRHLCSNCRQNSTELCCPHCHNKLPHPNDRTEEIILSIVGARRSGKTVYLSTLVDEFNRVMNPDYSLQPLGEEVTKRYHDVYRRPIKDGRLHDRTETAAMDSQIRHPLTFRLGQRSRGLDQSRTIVIHDTAGEQFRHQDQMRRFNRYLVHADGVIVFVDPEQIQKVRARMTNPPPKVESRAIDLLNTVHDLVINERDLSDRLLDLPLAIALTKIDLLQDPALMNNAPLITPGFALLEPSEHGPEFRQQHGNEIHEEVESLLHSLDEGQVVGAAASMFSRYLCFGVSALGHPPDDSQRTLTSAPEPMRMLDPFLWLLAHLNCIEYVE